MKHDVRLRIEGSLLEKLLEQALKKGASFARVRRNGKRAVIVETDDRSARILVALCKRYYLDLRILKRSGLASFIDTLRARWTIFPGILLGMLLCALFLGRVWLVDISFTGPCSYLGNEEHIRTQLREYGVQAGMAAGRIDADFLQKQLSASAGDYSYIGVRRQGIRLLVEAAPEVPAPELYAISNARDLVAARDGVVQSVTVYSGESAVEKGDTVLQGDLLIRGEEAVSKDQESGEEITSPVSALGEVIARCWYEGRASAALEGWKYVRTGESRTGCRLKLMGLQLPISPCESYTSEDMETQVLPVVGLFLPLEIERSVHWETRPEPLHSDPEPLINHLTALAQAQARSAITDENDRYEIASAWTDVTQNENTLQVRAVYEIYTDIAAERDALIEEVY